jgi:hypothetical protein
MVDYRLGDGHVEEWITIHSGYFTINKEVIGSMDFWSIVWQILAYGALAAIVIVLIFAILEPGPLQEQRRFGRHRTHQEEADEDKRSEHGSPLPGEER